MPDSTIQSRCDPDDADGDGVSGRPNFVVSHRTGKLELGRFGWKANPHHRAAGGHRFQQDLGITSSLFPLEPLHARQAASPAVRSGGDPDDEHKLEQGTVLLPPLEFRRSACPMTPRSTREGVFGPSVAPGATSHAQHWRLRDVRPTPMSGSVHTPTCCCTTWGPDWPTASPRAGHPIEWSTPPLWGIGPTRWSTGTPGSCTTGGRATSEAILWHGGEAEAPAQVRGAHRRAAGYSPGVPGVAVRWRVILVTLAVAACSASGGSVSARHRPQWKKTRSTSGPRPDQQRGDHPGIRGAGR